MHRGKDDVMEYALLIYGDEKAWAARTDEERRTNGERHARFVALLAERGVEMRGGRELALAGSATTLRKKGDAVSVTDGPFAETAEVLGGFYLLAADDLDVVLELARELPEDTIEIRPIVPLPE
ncbi:hypothetical protein Voc01_087790 [Virgisporangium ochraceum]|uniref:YCII-related domain-containing protein n=2 Tax=Virgisporangium ochraceum TaxID=65505 RepID=A0A8J4A153_9ACTN|nr:hypothetical protein Voc01_087790 [Virgisporangium ochraceum]